MPGNDLIGPKQAPSGDIVGLEVRGGDSFHILGNGPVISATDPLTGLNRYFRMNIRIDDNGDGTTTAVPILEEVVLT